MCLGIPGKVIERSEQDGLLMGRVDYGGTIQQVCLVCVPEVTVGEYVIVHAGLAITRLNVEEAEETLRLLREIAEAQDSSTSS